MMGNLWAKSSAKVNADAAKKPSPVTKPDNLTIDSDHQDEIALPESASASDSDDGSGKNLNAVPKCGNCGMDATPEKSLSLCRKCSNQHYCSKKCQKAHWSIHKKLCLASTAT